MDELKIKAKFPTESWNCSVPSLRLRLNFVSQSIAWCCESRELPTIELKQTRPSAWSEHKLNKIQLTMVLQTQIIRQYANKTVTPKLALHYVCLWLLSSPMQRPKTWDLPKKMGFSVVPIYIWYLHIPTSIQIQFTKQSNFNFRHYAAGG